MNNDTITLIDTRIGEHMRRLGDYLNEVKEAHRDHGPGGGPTIGTSIKAAFPAPAPLADSPASDGTVDAAFVAANAGEYKRAGLVNIYRSDGQGSVRLIDGEDDCGPWAGVPDHTQTRFRPIPTPAASVEGEPVNPYTERRGWTTQEYDRYMGWHEAEQAWRAHLTRTLASRDTEIAKLQAELAAVRGERDAMKPVVDAAGVWETYWSSPETPPRVIADLEVAVRERRIALRQHAAKGGGK